jgi:hypothetical protein
MSVKAAFITFQYKNNTYKMLVKLTPCHEIFDEDGVLNLLVTIMQFLVNNNQFFEP